MTSELTRAPSAVARVTAVAVAVAAVSVAAITPAAAQSDQDERKPELRSAEATATVQDVSGLSVTRTWKIDKRDPNTLTATITAANPSSAPITTSIVEPIPTTSLKRITFKPLSMQTSSIPGLGRFEVTVPIGSTVKFGYTARLAETKKATAQNQLDTAKYEIETALAFAQATDADRAIAAMKDRYSGPLELTEAFEEGVQGPGPTLGPVGTNIVRLTPASGCRVVARGCRFGAQDSGLREPKLGALEPAGIALVATASADVTDTALTCSGSGVEASGVMVKNWTVEPTAWRLAWAGWEVTQVRYTVATDLNVPRQGGCGSASQRTVTTGLLNGDGVPTIRQ